MCTAASTLRITESADGAIVLDVRQGRIFRLNSVASLVLKKVQQGCSISEIVHEICQTYSTSSDIVEPDVLELLSNLERYGLIHRSSQNL